MRNNNRRRCVISGTFDCEAYWRDKNLAKLPYIDDKQTDQIVSVMDELLFVFCKESDVLITRQKMDTSHKQYLSSIGFSFINNDQHLINEQKKVKKSVKKSVSQLLIENKDNTYFHSIIQEGMTYTPFSILPESEEVCKDYKLVYEHPSIEIIKKVNSKVYSTLYNTNAEMKNKATIVHSAEELEHIGNALLKNSKFLIKDIFGVSGKGNLLIESSSVFDRIINYLKLQEKRQKSILFIVEPFLQKDFDFSCQFSIDKNGQTQIHSVQRLMNNNFAYQGSFTADDAFLNQLYDLGYFEEIQKVSNQLHQDGYFGHVCIDSMILKDESLVPIVEINARKSMSLIKHGIDKYVSKHLLKCCFTYFTLSYSRDFSFEELLDELDDSGLLYKLGKEQGIIPLTSNTLLINKKMNGSEDIKKTVKGRIYIAIVYKEETQQVILNEKIKTFFEEHNFAVLN